MIVCVFGIAAGKRVKRRWTLIAEEGDGPEIPALVVPLLAARSLATRNCQALAMPGRCLRSPISNPHSADLQSPMRVRRIHSVLRDDGASGEAKVTGAANALGALVARIMRFPPAGQYELHVAFAEREGVERWTRAFGSYTFASTLSAEAGSLTERFGPLRFKFALPSNERGVAMKMIGWSAWRLPLPLFLAPRSRVREWEENGRFCFEVPIALPLVGKIVHYPGWLVLPP